MQNFNPFKWVAKWAKEINVDLNSTESQIGEIVNNFYFGKYYEFNCKRCGCNSSVELCKSCDY